MPDDKKPDKQPLFDDGDLPQWMQDAGVSFNPNAPSPAAPPAAPPLSAPPPVRSATPSGVTGDLPWQSGAAAPQTPGAAHNNEEELPPWMQSSATDTTSTSSSADFEMPDFADWQIPDAPSPSGDAPAKPGMTGMLPWRQDASDPADAPSVPGGTDVSWLDNVPAASTPSVPQAPIKSLKQTDPPAQPSAPPPGSRPTLRKLPSTPSSGGQPPNPPQAQPPEDLSGLTYEEWERRQIAQEHAAARDPNEALLDEVPDWFDTAAPTPAAPNAESSATANVPNAPEFVPDWFAGMEEQSANAAPDWFNTADLSGSALAGPETINTPTAQPPAAPSADDVPDWMRTGDVAGMDFEAMFGTPASEASNAVTSGADADTLDWMSDFGGDLPSNMNDMNTASKSSSKLPDVPVPQMPPAPVPSAEDDFASLDWLSGSTDVDSLPSMQGSDYVAPGQLPDWMSEIGSAPDQPDVPNAPAAESAAPNIPIAPSDSDIPEWMRDMAPAAPTPMAAADPLQDWFADSSANEPSASASGAQSETLEPGAIPDWLSGVQPGTASPPRPTPKAAKADLDLSQSFSSDDLDALLNMPASSTAVVPQPDLSMSQSASLDDFDLDKVLGPATPEETMPPAEAPTGLPPGVQPPGGGRGVRKLPTPTQVSPGDADEASGSAISAGQVPEYIKELRSGPKELNIGTVRIDVDEAPVAQLSDQLRQLRERAVQFAPPDQPKAMSTGPLAELQGTLTAEPILIKAATQPSIAANTVVSDLQGRRVKLIQNMLEIEDAEPQTGAAAAVKPRTRGRVKVDRLLITLVMFLALAAPFFTDGLNLVALPDTSKPTAQQFAVFNAVDSLQAGQPVLVAFEYGPTGSGELDDMARALLTDLFKRGAKPVIVSTNPSGAMHAESLLEVFGHNAAVLTTLNRIGKPLIARTDYVVLRYLPAGAAGVRSVFSAIYQGGFQAESDFLTDVEGQNSGLSLDKDVPALGTVPAVVIAETPDDVRNWVEQYRVLADTGSTPTAHLILAVAAAADATAQTYSASQPGIILGPLIGLRDATVYRALRQPPAKASDAKALDQRWQSTGIGALLAGVIIFLGSMFSLIQAVRRRGARR